MVCLVGKVRLIQFALLLFDSKLLSNGLSESISQLAVTRNSSLLTCLWVQVNIMFLSVPLKYTSRPFYFSNEVTAFQAAISTCVVLNFLTGIRALRFDLVALIS